MTDKFTANEPMAGDKWIEDQKYGQYAKIDGDKVQEPPICTQNSESKHTKIQFKKWKNEQLYKNKITEQRQNTCNYIHKKSYEKLITIKWESTIQ